MMRILDWVHENLDPTEQRIVANDGWTVSSFLWDLSTDEEENARDVFHRYSQDIWHQLLNQAECRGSTPLRVLDDYAKASGETICSPESFEITGLLWAIERACFQLVFTGEDQ